MENDKLFHICKCYFKRNIFVPSIKAHVEFVNETQFEKDYGTFVKKYKADKNSILNEIRVEIQRRKSFIAETTNRKQTIAYLYKPAHPHLYQFTASVLHPDFLDLVKSSANLQTISENFQKYKVCKPKAQLYQFPVFTHEFCQQLTEELKHFSRSDLPKARPNTMNNYGIIVDEIGFQPFVDVLRENYLNKLSRVLYPDFVKLGLDSHRAFTVLYSTEGDRKLDSHFDNAEVTLNVALNDCYEGGELIFGNLHGESEYDCEDESESAFDIVQHKFGWGILHRGRQMHSAKPLVSGERENLIIWMRSSPVRNNFCPMCNNKPDLLQMEHGCYGDGFTIE